jgi:hypothetical protein
MMDASLLRWDTAREQRPSLVTKEVRTAEELAVDRLGVRSRITPELVAKHAGCPGCLARRFWPSKRVGGFPVQPDRHQR